MYRQRTLSCDRSCLGNPFVQNELRALLGQNSALLGPQRKFRIKVSGLSDCPGSVHVTCTSGPQKLMSLGGKYIIDFDQLLITLGTDGRLILAHKDQFCARSGLSSHDVFRRSVVCSYDSQRNFQSPFAKRAHSPAVKFSHTYGFQALGVLFLNNC